MRKSTLRRAVALTAFTFATFAALAAQVDVAGVKLDDAIDVHGSKLQLNGAGVRYKAVFKVYTAGLYLGKKAGTPEEVLAAPGAKRVTITMLRDIDANELGKLFTRGVEDNSPKNEMSQLIPGLLRMSGIFSEQKQLKTGENFTIDWVPGSGTVISVKGVPQGEPIKEQAFFNALVRIWLGPSPADWKLKDALLGKG
ncbi:chalcone isomerase family protein [Variovorax sp. YR216]|uniref:chalcone isomerase family protein n=1 Tax=Variovorax sp. YR216 TaxID=1882828 RepID=UPI00089CA9FD|nr:chalcone isomerase family protein [Variovorax sp. YR216]SEB21449.1 Chalcone isomerase-like [Variovorax sp. YR216]